MKKILFASAVFAAFLMSACGGEKKEDKKEEKKEISEETKKAVDEIRTQFETLDADIKSIESALAGKANLTATTNLDSLKGVVSKWPKDKKVGGLSFMDTLSMDRAKIEEVESRFTSENTDWQSATNMVRELVEGVANNKMDAQEAEDRLGSVKALLDSFQGSIGQLKAEWAKIAAHDEMFKSMNQ